MRLTSTNRQKILLQSEGFTTRTSYDSRNSEYKRIYLISCGQLHIREIGKTSWADSRYDKEWIADNDETHRFLYNNLGLLNTDGID
jgi:hypothetical protein